MLPDRPWTARIHGCARPAQERLKAGQGTQMADTFQIVLRIKRLDVDAFPVCARRGCRQAASVLFQPTFPNQRGFSSSLAHLHPINLAP